MDKSGNTIISRTSHVFLYSCESHYDISVFQIFEIIKNIKDIDFGGIAAIPCLRTPLLQLSVSPTLKLRSFRRTSNVFTPLTTSLYHFGKVLRICCIFTLQVPQYSNLSIKKASVVRQLLQQLLC